MNAKKKRKNAQCVCKKVLNIHFNSDCTYFDQVRTERSITWTWSDGGDVVRGCDVVMGTIMRGRSLAFLGGFCNNKEVFVETRELDQKVIFLSELLISSSSSSSSSSHAVDLGLFFS